MASKDVNVNIVLPSGVSKTSTSSSGTAGIRPTTGDNVFCHYIGTLKSNGQKFDSSRDKRRPFNFTVGIGQVIQGWDIAMLQHLTLGERSIFEIASDKAYGPKGAGGVIPPDADLVFDIELLAINEQTASGFSLPGQDKGGCVLL
jgi:FKBP-type peptidyl-prolyl cis-trans isomerase